MKIPTVKVGTSVKVSFAYDGYAQTKTLKVKGAQKKFSYFDDYTAKHGTYADGSDYDPYTAGAWDRREKFNANIKVKPTYAANKKTTITVKQVTKGDKIKVKIGKKTYTKKITKSASTKSLVIKHPKVKAGTKISVIQYNKYKQKMGTAGSIVFSVKKLKKGLTKNQVKYMRTYGSPDSSSTVGGGWWRYDYFDGYSWVPSQTVYFTDGKVSGWTNY